MNVKNLGINIATGMLMTITTGLILYYGGVKNKLLKEPRGGFSQLF